MKNLVVAVLFTSPVLLWVKGSLAESNDPDYRFDYTYYPELNGFVKFHDVPLPWHDAERLCYYEGSTIMSPINITTAAIMQFLIESKHKRDTFTGFNSLHSKGNYYTTKGIPLSFTQYTWAKDEPNDVNGNKNCLVLSAEGTLSAVSCETIKTFICYRPYNGETLNDCGTVDNDYKLYQQTNKCYKFHRQSQIWRKAHQICAAENAHLVIINSAVESNVIKEIYAKYPAASIQILIREFESAAFIGFKYNPNTERYETLEGESLEKSGFNHFEPGNPDAPVSENVCGGVYRTGLLDDTYCDHQHAFICEKDPRYDLCG